MNQQSINKLLMLHPKLRGEAMVAWAEVEEAVAAHSGVAVLVDQSLRTFEQSNALYALGRSVANPDGKSKTKPLGNIVTNAKAGSSYHNYGLAFDFKMLTNGKPDWSVGPIWMKVVEVMKSHGWTWGGDFKTLYDAPHFEKTFGHNWRALLASYEAQEFIPGTNYVIIQ